MPHVIVKLAVGHSPDEKQALTDHIVAALTGYLGSPDPEISVALEEVPAHDWMDRIYAPDIAGNAGLLTKRPGYGPLA